MTDQLDCIVIGAGIAGLTAAGDLVTAGWRVLVLDKGRHVGGRTATRSMNQGTADHGAQYFTVRDAQFQTTVDQWLADGVVREWADGFPAYNEPEGNSPGGGHPRYCGVNGMRGMAESLAAALDVRVSTKVTEISTTDSGWQLTTQPHGADDTITYQTPRLLMTPPAEQSLALLDGVGLPGDVRAALEHIEYDPCFALMARLDGPSAVPAPGGVFMPGEPIRWLADNAQKGISDAPTITIHAGPEFTRAHYDDNRETVIKLLLEAAADYIGDATVIETQMLRWRYSQPTTLHPQKTLYSAAPAPVAFAGDAFNGAKVEGAYLSGKAAAAVLVAHTG